MKKQQLIFQCLMFLAFFTAHATVWRVNNNPGISANFANFTAAQSGATAGDTLYFEGSGTAYGDITITKPLVLIGPGYFLTENPQTQANITSAQFGNIYFNTGSSGSVIMGLTVTGNTEIKVGNIWVMRNKLKLVYINSTISYGNILISQNYLTSGIENSSGSSTIFNILITNNHINDIAWNVNTGISFPANFSGVISNNICDNGTCMSVHNFTISNNILISGTANAIVPTDNVFFNNICNHAQVPSGNNNLQNVNMTDVFLGATGNSTDGQWQLKAGSPAILAGNDGLDCGMFGGPTPYVLSGMPPIPSVYELIMPSSANNVNGLNVTVKAKSH